MGEVVKDRSQIEQDDHEFIAEITGTGYDSSMDANISLYQVDRPGLLDEDGLLSFSSFQVGDRLPSEGFFKRR